MKCKSILITLMGVFCLSASSLYCMDPERSPIKKPTDEELAKLDEGIEKFDAMIAELEEARVTVTEQYELARDAEEKKALLPFIDQFVSTRIECDRARTKLHQMRSKMEELAAN